MGLQKVQIIKYLQIITKTSFLTVLLTFQPHGIASSSKKSLKKVEILNLENQEMLFVKTFLIYDSSAIIFPDKHFLRNASQE